jgi:hypothetical protein
MKLNNDTFIPCSGKPRYHEKFSNSRYLYMIWEILDIVVGEMDQAKRR